MDAIVRNKWILGKATQLQTVLLNRLHAALIGGGKGLSNLTLQGAM